MAFRLAWWGVAAYFAFHFLLAAYRAFAELFDYGFFPTVVTQYQDRADFNILVRVITFWVGLGALDECCKSAANGISRERDKGTWPFLLTTPLSGAEILGSKLRATSRRRLRILEVLAPIWLTGLACGALHLPGVALLAMDLPLSLWAGTVFSLRAAVRSAEASVVQKPGEGSSVLLVVFHAPVILAATSSVPELREFFTQNPLIQLISYLYIVAVPLVTAVLARRAKRQMFERFDEWVGRPHRPHEHGAHEGPRSVRPHEALALGPAQ